MDEFAAYHGAKRPYSTLIVADLIVPLAGGRALRIPPGSWRRHWVVAGVASAPEAAVAEDKWVARHVMPLADVTVPEW